MLTNIDIEKKCKELKLNLVGVYSKNELVGLKHKLGGYIINLQDDNVYTDGEGNNGTHWVFFYIYSDEDRDDVEDDENDYKIAKALYFDSFGGGMPISVSTFLKDYRPVYCNNREIQNINSTECGWYCLALFYYLEKLQHSKTYLEDYEKFLNIWSNKPTDNLSILKAFMRKYLSS